jgi:hypothetical protein
MVSSSVNRKLWANLSSDFREFRSERVNEDSSTGTFMFMSGGAGGRHSFRVEIYQKCAGRLLNGKNAEVDLVLCSL